MDMRARYVNIKNSIDTQHIATITAQRNALLAAIRKHRDVRGDDRCYLDDAELYRALPEGDTRPLRESAVTLENCERFIRCRQQGREYISPEREIERLRALCAHLQGGG